MNKIRMIGWMLLLVLGLGLEAAQVREIKVPSPSMEKEVPAIIILPQSYAFTNSAYPVVYLLHGYSSSPRRTIDTLSAVLENAADKHQMIIVLPDGGYNSWYFDSPTQPKRKYETFIGSELVRFTDDTYRTIRERKFRAITGGSMGGHGAMFVGLRHRDQFGLIGDMSGGVDFRPFPDNWDIKQTLGPISEFPQRWDEHVVVNNVSGLKPGDATIYIDIGTEDFFLEVNRALHKKLLEMHIPHVYVERPGHHDDDYWRVASFYQLEFFAENFKAERTPVQKESAK